MPLSVVACDCEEFQDNLHRLDEWETRWQIKLSVAKCEMKSIRTTSGQVQIQANGV